MCVNVDEEGDSLRSNSLNFKTRRGVFTFYNCKYCVTIKYAESFDRYEFIAKFITKYITLLELQLILLIVYSTEYSVD